MAQEVPTSLSSGRSPTATWSRRLRSCCGPAKGTRPRETSYAPATSSLAPLGTRAAPGRARDHLDTEDIVQDTLMQSVRRLDKFTPEHEHAFCAYVCQALRNRLRDVVRRAAARPSGDPLSPDEPAADPSPLEQAVGRQTLARYETALQQLRESDRELVIARVELGLDYAEIAGLTGKSSIASARVAVSRALLRLGVEMGHERRS